ncbi:ketoacyl-ACP synthase III [Campylobacter armoricus]|uniref:Ketoacyl-ACP synthase III n=1 Tax=Campylobacter armoricus TaxID=2505970 RepID=A0A7L5IQ24_9BACT|nr:ketoacyl-ACP synthase III [Campylobacter armoricus]QKF80199.1 ketoacyl-ACP synthase III [Campylobacter armoricus]
MQNFSKGKIRHICSVLPSKKVSNFDNPFFSEKDKQKIIKQIGVETRYILDKDKNEKISELFIKAAEATLEALRWEKNTIDAIIVLTQSNEFRYPAMACYIQGKIGLRKENLIAFDVNLGCSGYVYALNIAYNYISNGLKRVLLLVGDASSETILPDNRETAFLFGDGVSCTAVEAENSKSYFCFKTLGEGYDLIIAPYKDGYMQMKGIEVFDYTIRNIPLAFENILKLANLTKEQISQFYFHQANSFVLNYLGNKLGISEKLPNNMLNFGNENSNSIPLLICDLKNQNYKNVMLMGYGVGFSVATCILEELDCTCNIIYNKLDK